jgi:hypothetical protein
MHLSPSLPCLDLEPDMSIDGFTCERVAVALRNLLFFAAYIACDLVIFSTCTDQGLAQQPQ